LKGEKDGTQHTVTISGYIDLPYQYGHHDVEDEQKHG